MKREPFNERDSAEVMVKAAADVRWSHALTILLQKPEVTGDFCSGVVSETRNCRRMSDYCNNTVFSINVSETRTHTRSICS